VKQAITLSLAQQTEATASMLHARFNRAKKPDELIKLLANCMRDIPVVYIIINVNLKNMDTADREPNISSAIFKLLDVLEENSWKLNIRVFMTSNRGTGEYHGGCQTQTLRGFNLGQQQPKSFKQRRVYKRGRGSLKRR
jgi:hypothetical protein